MIPYIKGERKNNNNNKKKKRKENSLPRRRRWGDIMRRLGFERVVNVKEEEEEGEEGGLVDGGGGGGGERDYFSRVTSMVAPRPRRSFHRSSTGLSSALSFVSARRSYSYDKLGQVPIQLTVVKLDGSSFEIDVRNMATIADLKLAVERAFSHMPTKGPSKISWRHVWGHFCLSYHGQKLLHDDDFINTYGIKEGDQLRFVRHVSIAYNLIKKRSRKLIDAPKPQTIPDNFEEKCQKLEEGNDDLENLRQYQYEPAERRIRRRRWTFKMGRWIRWLL